MRLLAVHQGGGLGGAPVSLLKLLAALDRSEFEPLAIFTEPGPAVVYGRQLGIAVEVVPTGGGLFYSAHARLGVRSLAQFLMTFPRAVQTAQTTLRREKPDLMHLNTSVLLAWAAAARRQRIPVVWVVREVLGSRTWQARYILRHARRVVAVSDAVAACFPVPVDRVHNAVDLADFRLGLLEQAGAVRAELGIPSNRFVLMAIGAVQRPKGHWLLLDAFSQLDDKVQLVLVAGGVGAEYASSPKGRLKRALRMPLDNLDALLHDAARRGLSNRITVTGFRTDVARMLACADILVFPSLEPEGFGRPIIEAMALARPVVATDVGPTAELLGDQAGLLVRPDAAQLARAIGQLLTAPEERARMGRAGRARVEACFTLERQVTEMSAIYRQAVRA